MAFSEPNRQLPTAPSRVNVETAIKPSPSHRILAGNFYIGAILPTTVS